MGDDTSIQHLMMVQFAIGAIAAVATLLFALAGKWFGGIRITLLAITAAILLSFHPLIHANLFSNLTTDRMQKILAALIPFTIVLVCISFRKIPILLHPLIALIGPGLILAWVFHDYAVQDMPREVLYLHRIVPLSLGLLVMWALIEPIAVRSPGPAAPMIITLIAIGSTFLLMLSAEANAGLMSTPVSGTAAGAALAAAIVAMAKSNNLSLSRGPVLLWLTMLGCMFAYLWISDDELPVKYLCWLASVPLLAWIPEIGPIHRLKWWKRESIRLVLVAIPVVMTMALAFREHKQAAAASGDEYGLISSPSANLL
jgi:hypothetical protein